MKVCDIVQIDDGSWSLAIVDGIIEHVIGNSLWNRRFRVLAKGGIYPTEDHGNGGVPRNNIMLIDVNDLDFILFTRQTFCRVIESPPANKTLVAAIVAEAAAYKAWKITCEAAENANDRRFSACEAYRVSLKALADIRKALVAS